MPDNKVAPLTTNVGVKTSSMSLKLKLIIGIVVVTVILLILFLVILPQAGVYNLSGFGEPGSFRTWSLLDSFNVFNESKPIKKVKINTLNSLKGINVITKADITTITSLRSNRSISLPTKLGLGLSQEAEDLYSRINIMLIDLLKMADSLKSNIIVNTTNDVENFNEKVQILLILEKQLDALVAKELTGIKLTTTQNTLEEAKHSRHSILEVSEGFSNDLPNPNTKFTDDMNYNDYMADVALEPSIKKQHTDYVNDKAKSSNSPSYLPTPSHSTNLVPFVGLRRPEYAVNGIDLVEDSARSIPSTIDFNQLDKAVKISWK